MGYPQSYSTNFQSNAPSNFQSQVDSSEMNTRSTNESNNYQPKVRFEEPQVLAKSEGATKESRSLSSEISVEEEKEEEASPTVKFRMKDESMTLPKWVVEKY